MPILDQHLASLRIIRNTFTSRLMVRGPAAPAIFVDLLQRNISEPI